MNESQLKQLGYVKGDDGEWRKTRNRLEELSAAFSEQLARKPLDKVAKGEAKGGDGYLQRYSITFRIFATKPCDWDNWHIKEIQDLVVQSGILPDDNYRILEGRVISVKVGTKAEEKTVIEIVAL